MYCTKCGAILVENEEVCQECGAKVLSKNVLRQTGQEQNQETVKDVNTSMTNGGLKSVFGIVRKIFLGFVILLALYSYFGLVGLIICGIVFAILVFVGWRMAVTEKNEKNQSDRGVKIHEQTSYNDESNTGEDRKITHTGIKFKNKPKILVLGACGIVVIILIAFMLFGGRNPVSDTKRIIFEQYGTISMGEATDRYLEEVDWEAEKITDDEYKVTLRAFSDEVAFRFWVEFRVTYMDDMVYAIPRAVSIAGEEYTDDMSLWGIMSIIYGKSIEEAEEAYWEVFWQN